MTRTTALTTADIQRYVTRGRRLQRHAVRGGLADAGRWILRFVAGAINRRTFRIARRDCGAHV